LVRFSLSDFPGTVAAVIFTQGCNFRCPFCHNGGLIPLGTDAGELVSERELWGFLKERQGKLGGVVVSGGEPTLQPDLPAFLKRLKSMGFRVKLDTNGSRPEVLERLLAEGLVDYLAMDVKAPFADYPQLSGVRAPVERVRESIGLIAASGVEHEFRTTFVPALMSDEDLAAIHSTLPIGSVFKVQAFKPELALDPTLRQVAVGA
jgi:pyruvate formate lyase activating enzyme